LPVKRFRSGDRSRLEPLIPAEGEFGSQTWRGSPKEERVKDMRKADGSPGALSRLERTRRIDFGDGDPTFAECIPIFIFHARPAGVAHGDSGHEVNTGIYPEPLGPWVHTPVNKIVNEVAGRNH